MEKNWGLFILNPKTLKYELLGQYQNWVSAECARQWLVKRVAAINPIQVAWIGGERSEQR